MPALEAWELYGTLRLAKLVEQELNSLINKAEVVEGDGGVGTVVKLTFPPGITTQHEILFFFFFCLFSGSIRPTKNRSWLCNSWWSGRKN